MILFYGSPPDFGFLRGLRPMAHAIGYYYNGPQDLGLVGSFKFSVLQNLGLLDRHNNSLWREP